MKKGRFILLWFIMMVAQIILCNYFGLSRYVLISVLPVLILMLPLGMGSIATMLVAFACGLAVDFFSTGMLGITPLALVPVALVRRLLVSMVIGDDQISRDDELSFQAVGVPRMLLAILITCALFFLGGLCRHGGILAGRRTFPAFRACKYAGVRLCSQTLEARVTWKPTTALSSC